MDADVTAADPARAEDQATRPRRLAWYHEVVCRELVSLAVDVMEPEHFVADVDSRRHGWLKVVDVRSGPQDVRRTRALIGLDDERYLKVAVLLAGRCRVTQRGRTATLSSGDVVCYDTAEPYDFHMATPFRLVVFLLPERRVGHRLRGFDQATVRPLAAFGPYGALAVPVLRTVAATAASVGGTPASHIGDAVVDITAGLVAESRGRAVDGDVARAALRARARQVIERRLTDPDLGPPDVAAALGVSVRYLHQLFEGEGVSVARFIRRRRLDGVVRDLADPQLSHLGIAAIAALWGFTDAAAFSRTFRAAFGEGPRAYRMGLVPEK